MNRKHVQNFPQFITQIKPNRKMNRRAKLPNKLQPKTLKRQTKIGKNWFYNPNCIHTHIIGVILAPGQPCPSQCLTKGISVMIISFLTLLYLSLHYLTRPSFKRQWDLHQKRLPDFCQTVSEWHNIEKF